MSTRLLCLSLSIALLAACGGPKPGTAGAPGEASARAIGHAIDDKIIVVVGKALYRSVAPRQLPAMT